MEALKTKTFLGRRSEKREHVGGTYLVKLDPGKGVPPFTCFVWDISESGIRLKLCERANLPPVVHILIGRPQGPKSDLAKGRSSWPSVRCELITIVF
jgi:hypothetical protein